MWKREKQDNVEKGRTTYCRKRKHKILLKWEEQRIVEHGRAT